MKRMLGFLLVALLLVGAVMAQFALHRRRPIDSPVLADGALAALGGFRSIAAEVVWFRADRLQEEGRYVELAQLASMLTMLEPHTPEVWCYSAWNLAYNISVMMATDEDRWRWVLAGICLLRDEGLALNPNSVEIHRELAWLFELKLGAKVDSAAPTYRRHWQAMVEDVKSRGAWDELGMNPMQMLEVERETGFNDWTDPAMSAIYWAVEGRKRSRGESRDRAFLKEIFLQSVIIYQKSHQP